MTSYVRSNRRRVSGVLALSMLAALAAVAPRGARAESDGGLGPQLRIPRPITVNLAAIAAQSPAAVAKPSGKVLGLLGALQAGPDLGEEEVDMARLGGIKAPGSRAVIGGGNARGWLGIDLLAQNKAGTGKYAGSGQGLEPPDQALCVGNGFVMEGVNQAFQIYRTSGHALTPAILMAQFFNELPAPAVEGLIGPTSFLSDPKCIYDAQTKRFFVTSLEIDEASTGAFTRSHNLIAVSKTSDPTKSWWVYRMDITDDGLMGTPFHLTCPCLGDQPLIGADANGFYMSTNEYSDSEIVPIQPPPAILPVLNKAFTLPNYRNGQAQVYAMSKRALINGQSPRVVQFDTNSIPVPAGAPMGAVWSSLQPAFQSPGDHSTFAKGGVEYFMSQLDFAMSGDNRVAVWALTNTASLNTTSPKLSLLKTIIGTRNPKDTYTYANAAAQKAGPIPNGAQCFPVACNEEKLNANDDRMNQVMLTNGHLWSAVNTLMPEYSGHPRNGIMYFEVAPSVVGGVLHATMVRDGYITVPKESVLFPSIAASPNGPVVMGFSVSGLSYFPSTGWARLDGVAAGQAPVVHISGVGKAPEDGFTGYCIQGIFSNIGGLCSDEKARWGDYSAGVIDESGCAWFAAEYISGIHREDLVGNWSTYITRVPLPGCP
jgi:hypothetical protein